LLSVKTVVGPPPDPTTHQVLCGRIILGVLTASLRWELCTCSRSHWEWRFPCLHLSISKDVFANG